MATPIYLDNNATTRVDPSVVAAMMPFFTDQFGNASSMHAFGSAVSGALAQARQQVQELLGAAFDHEVMFTSGGSESNNTAILSALAANPERREIVTSAVEHPAVLQCCAYLARQEGFEVTYLPVNQEGMVSPASLAEAIRSDTILVSVMAANNEIGTIQPVPELGGICRERGVLFHTDAVQWLGKEPFGDVHQFNADLVSICAHKIHGPKGAGALFIRSPFQPDPILFGGSHENERRAGTENLAGIIGLVEAMERFIHPPVFNKERLAPLADRLLCLVDRLPGVQFVGSRRQRLTNTVSFLAPGCDSIALLAGLDMEGIRASSGSACSAGSLEPSHVIQALRLPEQASNSLVRFSLGRNSTLQEVEYVEETLPEVIRRARK